MNYQDFAGRVGEPFTIGLPDGTTGTLELIDCKRNRAPAGHLSFQALFLMSPDGPAQGTYSIGAAGLEPEPVFVAPVRQRPDGIEYVAVFNQTDDETAVDGR